MIQLSKNLQFNPLTEEFIFNNEVYTLKSVEKILQGWTKFKKNTLVALQGNTFRKDDTRRRNKKITERLLKIDTFVNFGKLYRDSRIGKQLKAEHNATKKTKYTPQKLLETIRQHVTIEIKKDSTGEILQRIGVATSLKDISIRVIGKLWKNPNQF